MLPYPPIMSRLLISVIIPLVILLGSMSLSAQEGPDVIWISADGISRHTFYALLQKKKLPNIQKLIRQGNYRNMDILTPDPQLGYVHFLTGLNNAAAIDPATRKIKKMATVFEKTKDNYPELAVHLFLSETDAPQTPLSLLNKTHLQNAGIGLMTSTADSQLLSAAEKVIAKKSPFFIFIQQSDPAASVFRYREGTEHYSDSILTFDRHIGQLLAYYKQANRKNQLYVIISSSYGFEKNSRKPKAESWVLSNHVVTRKAFSGDIVPSILRLYGIPAQRPPYIGNRFF